VLAQLRPQDAARLMQLIPEQMRAEVVYRAANMGPTSPGAMEAIIQSLIASTHTPTAAEAATEQQSGVQFLVDILQNLDRSTERQLLGALKEIDGDFAGGVEEQLLVFEDLFKLDDRQLQALLRRVQPQTLALALRGTDDSIKQRALTNISTRAREEVEQEMELTGPVRATEVEKAQREITNLARKLEAEGEINLQPEQVEYI